ncbi:MAG TPA: SAF domain-containing protein [Solirubrobacterales bacterium]|nr:SAF domain-containing protein [Solirubrobacterales bacterium]
MLSRRGRSLAFLVAALIAAAGAAAIADGYGSSVARGYGELQPVLVAAEPLRKGQTIDPALAGAGLEVRRVPVRFVPPGALAAPAEAVGLAPQAPIPAGSYLLVSQLQPPRAGRSDPALGRGRQPVEIAVSGADALAVVGGEGTGARVDVVVTTEPRGSGPGRTYVAAAAVPLLALSPGADGPGPGGIAAATLGLTRAQALRLIAAQSFARQVTLIPRGLE